jgi:hypothetical protein
LDYSLPGGQNQEMNCINTQFILYSVSKFAGLKQAVWNVGWKPNQSPLASTGSRINSHPGEKTGNDV